MATNNTPTTLGNIEFSDIKQSLTEYLRSQSVFAGYNFNGSAIQTMIDLMAYNTFYYAYYANMINAEAFLDSAQKEDSMISLCKPLGFAVPSRTSASATIQVSGLPTNDTITAGNAFISTNSNGTEYRFYNLTDISVVNNVTEPFEVYEASRYVEFDAIPTFDYDNQRISIAADGFDLSTIQVTVTEEIDDETEITEIWTPVENIGYNPKVNENIYFVERTSTGFAILFGSKNSVGRSINDKITKVIVRYLITNGSSANGLILWKNTLDAIVTFANPAQDPNLPQYLQETSGGKDAPNLDEVRFLAPKWFAAQERAVTVNDYKALLLQSGYFTSENDFNVFGGQDLIPPRFGRVFITSNLDPANPKVSEMINFLKERSVVTILPEYASPQDLNAYADFSFRLSPGTPNTPENRITILNRVKSIFESKYAKNAEFNVSFNASNFIQTLKESSNPDVRSLIISPDEFKLYVRQILGANQEHILNLENQLYLPLNTSVAITEPFDAVDGLVSVGKQAILKIYATNATERNTTRNLELWETTGTQETKVLSAPVVGTYNAGAGSIIIKKDVIKTSAVINAVFDKKSINFQTINQVTFKYGSVVIG